MYLTLEKGIIIIWSAALAYILMQRTIPYRLIIYPKDVEIISGRSYRTACTLIQTIKKALGKSKHQYLSIREFCRFMDLEKEIVQEMLKD